MSKFKYTLARELTISRTLMAAGALWIIIYGLLVANGIIHTYVNKWYVSGINLILIGLFYILIPFSTKPGWWSRSWAIFLTAISLITLLVLFFGKNLDYQSIWTYFQALPYLLMAAGSILWVIQA